MSGSQTTTKESDQVSNRTVPGWLTEGQQNLVGQAQNMLGAFLQNPAYMTAGFTPDQTAGFDLARSMAMNAFTMPPNSVGQINFDPSQAGNAKASTMTAAQLSPTAYQPFLNPYTQTVVDATMNNLNRQRQQQSAEIGARAAAAGSYGGSREAVQRAELDKNFSDMAATTIAQLMSQGYDKATATALANTQLEQQANAQNSQLQTQVALQNAQNQLAAQEFGANLGLQVPQINAALQTMDQQRQLQALQTLLGTGGAQQQLAQTNLNIPWTTLQMLANILGPTLNNTDTSTHTSGVEKATSSSSPGIGQLLGAGLSMLKFSDDKAKTNKEKLGNVMGIPMYAYDYKSDVEAAKKSGKPMGPKRVGPMASDIEKVDPKKVGKIGGKKVIGG